MQLSPKSRPSVSAGFEQGNFRFQVKSLSLGQSPLLFESNRVIWDSSKYNADNHIFETTHTEIGIFKNQ